MGPNSFVFAYIFGEKCLRRRSTPPRNGSTPPLREILDPPLIRPSTPIETRQPNAWMITLYALEGTSLSFDWQTFISFQAPGILIFSFVFMWLTIGPPSLAGLAVVALIVPSNGYLLIKYVRNLQVKKQDYKYYPIPSNYSIGCLNLFLRGVIIENIKTSNLRLHIARKLIMLCSFNWRKHRIWVVIDHSDNE